MRYKLNTIVFLSAPKSRLGGLRIPLHGEGITLSHKLLDFQVYGI